MRKVCEVKGYSVSNGLLSTLKYRRWSSGWRRRWKKETSGGIWMGFFEGLEKSRCADEGNTKDRWVGNLETRVMTVTSADKNYVYLRKWGAKQQKIQVWFMFSMNFAVESRLTWPFLSCSHTLFHLLCLWFSLSSLLLRASGRAKTFNWKVNMFFPGDYSW